MGKQVDKLGQSVEFTYDWYQQFLEGLQADGYTFQRFGEPLEDGDIVLRHDVDLSPAAALKMARIEDDLGIDATYFVLLSSSLYNPFEAVHRERIREIESLGHDIGLHFSTHEYWETPPETETLETGVRSERSILSQVVTDLTDAVSFHKPPSWVLDRPFESFENTYAPQYFSDIEYVSDSKQRWRRDTPSPEELPSTLQILSHPGLWGSKDVDREGRIDRAINRSCRRSRRKAYREFLDGVNSS